MTNYCVILSLLILCLVIGNLIQNKKFPLLTIMLFAFVGLSKLIQIIDPAYYSKITEQLPYSNDENQFLFGFLLMILIIGFIEEFILYLMHKKAIENKINKKIETMENNKDALTNDLKQLENLEKSFVLGSYEQLEQALNDGNQNFEGIIVLRLNHICIYSQKDLENTELIEVNDQTIRLQLSAKYLSSLNRFLDEDKTKIYKLGESEFGLLIHKTPTISFLIHKLKRNPSCLSNFCYFIGQDSYIIKTKVSIVMSINRASIDLLYQAVKNLDSILTENYHSIVVEYDKKDTIIHNSIDINIKKDIIN